jgi:hypothetical protein
MIAVLRYPQLILLSDWPKPTWLKPTWLKPTWLRYIASWPPFTPMRYLSSRESAELPTVYVAPYGRVADSMPQIRIRPGASSLSISTCVTWPGHLYR